MRPYYLINIGSENNAWYGRMKEEQHGNIIESAMSMMCVHGYCQAKAKKTPPNRNDKSTVCFIFASFTALLLSGLRFPCTRIESTTIFVEWTRAHANRVHGEKQGLHTALNKKKNIWYITHPMESVALIA